MRHFQRFSVFSISDCTKDLQTSPMYESHTRSGFALAFWFESGVCSLPSTELLGFVLQSDCWAHTLDSY